LSYLNNELSRFKSDFDRLPLQAAGLAGRGE
jgi:hypothetical protein